MKPENILSQLKDLETSLAHFSFEELSSEEAQDLRNTFDSFRDKLERKVFGEPQVAVKAMKQGTSLPDGIEDQLRFIATVSHELRTPLNGIMGFTDLLQESQLSREQLGQVHAIKCASQGLMNIINELLEYSKLSAGLEHFEKVDFNIQSLVKEVTYLCDTLIIDKHISFHSSIDQNIPSMLNGDPSKLTQVLLNLLGNSIKFVNQGNISLHIGLKEKQYDQFTLEFTVTDTGIGISENDLKHIFTAFRQAGDDLQMRYSGTGLGLNIVKQIIEQMGGGITVESEVNVGTTFTFTLPFGLGKRVRKKEKGGINAGALKGMRILVFEDNPLNQKMIEQRLRSWGCVPYITDNARYGIQLLEDKFVDLVLMDLCMPVMDGFKISKIIRQHGSEKVKQVPIIALSADYTAKDRAACEEVGMNDFVLKPFRAEELIDKILRHTGKQPDAGSEHATNRDITDSTSNEFIDLGPLLEDCMGQLDMLEDLINLYQQNALEFIGMVKVHIEHRDFDAIAKCCHKIKCGLKMFQTKGLQELAEQIHRSARTEEDLEHLTNLLECFTEEYPKVDKALTKALTDLKNKQ